MRTYEIEVCAKCGAMIERGIDARGDDYADAESCIYDVPGGRAKQDD